MYAALEAAVPNRDPFTSCPIHINNIFPFTMGTATDSDQMVAQSDRIRLLSAIYSALSIMEHFVNGFAVRRLYTRFLQET